MAGLQREIEEKGWMVCRKTAVGNAILGHERLAVETLRAADAMVGCTEDALDLLVHPQRLIATLRR